MKKNMPPEKIQDLLTARGVQASGIARELNVTAQAVHLAIYGKSKSNKIQGHIADNLGLSTEIIWPELYCSKPAPRNTTRPLSKGFIQ